MNEIFDKFYSNNPEVFRKLKMEDKDLEII